MKKRYLFLMLYLLCFATIYLASATLSKYVTEEITTGEFSIGARLFFNYERGELYRNQQLIVGVPIEENVYNSKGEVISTSRRIETMNVAPGDNLVYHFYVSNYELDSNTNEVKDANGVDGIVHTSASALLSMPVHQTNYELKCTITYREIYSDNSYSQWKDFTSDFDLNLPKYSETNLVKYEFQVYVVLDDQIEATSNDDYIGATLSIYLFIDAADKQE